MEQFRRMLLSKLRVTFENASGEIELWNKSASAQVDSQLRERRRGFKRRREALERIQTAAVELEQRIGELESQDTRDQQVLARVQQLLANVRERVEAPILGEVDVDVLIDAPPVAPARRA
jgi:exonuclease VII large subunit